MNIPSSIRSRGYLPHWEGTYAIYFVTFRLADSLPREVLTRLRAKVKRSKMLSDILTTDAAIAIYETLALPKAWSIRCITLTVRDINCSHGASCPTTCTCAFTFWDHRNWPAPFTPGSHFPPKRLIVFWDELGHSGSANTSIISCAMNRPCESNRLHSGKPKRGRTAKLAVGK